MQVYEDPQANVGLQDQEERREFRAGQVGREGTESLEKMAIRGRVDFQVVQGQKG